MSKHTLRNKNVKKRCAWCEGHPYPPYLDYHDEEWGVPVHDDRLLFEALVLDGAQAGLSWLTILKKRENYRRAFDGFDAKNIARYNKSKIKTLLSDAGIVRNRLKIESAIKNAKAFLLVQKEFGSFDKYFWGFTGGKPIVNRRRSMREIPTSSVESDAMSSDLKRRGFTFVGTTICYALMQAVGMVNDHLVDCFRYPEISSGKFRVNKNKMSSPPATIPAASSFGGNSFVGDPDTGRY